MTHAMSKCVYICECENILKSCFAVKGMLVRSVQDRLVVTAYTLPPLRARTLLLHCRCISRGYGRVGVAGFRATL
jgi:hypothetical protein